MCFNVCCLHLLQLWKNDTVAEQEKHSPKEKPILLSKDIESKLALLDREVNYLLNKAKFTKPKAKAKNSTSTDKSSKPNNLTEENDAPPHTQESTDLNDGRSTLVEMRGGGGGRGIYVCMCVPKSRKPRTSAPS